MKDIEKKLFNIQQKLKAPKGQMNSFGGYKYRSCEDILEALKPMLKEEDCVLLISDKINALLDRVYVEAQVTLRCGEEAMIVTASARESEDKKGMDTSQITGAASSYARKYALNGMFLIDDTKDADTMKAPELSTSMIEKLEKYGVYKEGMTYNEGMKVAKKLKKDIDDGKITKIDD